MQRWVRKQDVVGKKSRESHEISFTIINPRDISSYNFFFL